MTLVLKSLNINKWPLIICVLGFVLNFIAYYPGFLSPDTFDQYGQALTGVYDDWHPPVMAVLWSLFIKIHSGTLIMLLFQLMLLWLSVYLLLITIKSSLWYIIILFFSLAPFVQNFTGYIIKDTHLAFTWLLAVAIMFRGAIRKNRLNITEAVICLLLIIYGSWVRINALPGAIPLCYLLCSLFFTNAGKYIKFVGVAIAILLIGFGQWIFTYKIMKAEKAYPQAKLYLHDITGVYVKTGISFYPQFLYSNHNFDTATLRKGYHPATFDDLWPGKKNDMIFSFEDDSQINSLKNSWMLAIRTCPRVYIQNRALGFLYYLRLKKRNEFFYYYFPEIYPVPNILGITYHRNIISNIFLKPIELQKRMPYMRPWFWLLLNISLFAFIGKFRNFNCSFVYKTLLLSSLFYLLPAFFIFPIDTDFRYFYWNCIACSLAVCILIVDRFYFVRLYDEY